MSDEKVVKIYTAEDNLQADMILDTLKNNGVPAYKIDEGAGGFMNMYAGSSMLGEDIYVAEEQAELAAEVIEGMGLDISQEEQE